jgi:hypothetical protein
MVNHGRTQRGIHWMLSRQHIIFDFIYLFYFNKVCVMCIIIYCILYIHYSLAYLQSSLTCVGGVCPVTVSVLVLCEDVRVEASILSVGWHVLWNVTDRGFG